MYDTRRNAKRTGAEKDIGVCRGAKGVADNEESDILSVRVSQDFIALRLDHVTVSDDERLPVQLFLFQEHYKPRNERTIRGYDVLSALFEP